MVKWSWIPGLPSLGSSFDLWAVDPKKGEVALKDCAFIFLVVDDEEGYLLANRTGTTMEFDGAVFVRRDHEKEHTSAGGRTLLIKRWRLVAIEEVDQIDGESVRRPPTGLQQPLPPRDFTEEELADAVSAN